ncbi:MAG: hypothetical protein U0636_11795 [Phycisphaerales bacterium]
MGSPDSDSLTVNTGGATAFNAAVSGLGALTTDAAGTSTVAADLAISGNLSLGGATCQAALRAPSPALLAA